MYIYIYVSIAYRMGKYSTREVWEGGGLKAGADRVQLHFSENPTKPSTLNPKVNMGPRALGGVPEAVKGPHRVYSRVYKDPKVKGRY